MIEKQEHPLARIEHIRAQVIKEGYNNWRYYLVYCRLYTHENKYFTCKFIIDFDDDDVWDCLEDKKDNIKNYETFRKKHLNNIITIEYEYLNSLKTCEQVIDYCNVSIEAYNKYNKKEAQI